MHPSVQAANGFRTSRFLARNRTASSSNSHAVPRAPHTAARGGRYPCAGASASGSECSTSPTPLARRHLLQAGLVTSAAWAAQQLQPARAEAAILVGPAQSGGKFATINEAIAAAEQGGIITVLPGRYEERITLDGKFVTIQAAQAGSVEVVWESSRPYEHTLECKNTQGAVVVRGMLLRHRSPSVAQNYCVFVGAGSSLVLEACDVSSSSGNGVGVEGATLQLKDSQVHNCERHGVAAFGGFEGAPGRCLVMGCAIKSNKLSGVFVRDGGNAVLRDNTVVDNGEYGVALLDGCTARLFDNKVAGNAAGSVRVDVGSVAVDVSEVNGKNALDTPAAAIRL